MSEKTGVNEQDDAPSKREFFVKHYVANGFNATQAAISAGYSEKTATSQGNRLLTFVEIREAIKLECAQALKEVEVDKVKWFQEAKRIAFSDIRDLGHFDSEGLHIKNSSELSDDIARTVESIEFTESENEHSSKRNLKVKLHSKTKGLELLGKALGMLIDKSEVEHSGTIGFTAMSPEEYETAKAVFLAQHADRLKGK